MSTPAFDVELQLTSGDDELSVFTEGDRLIVDAPSFRTALAARSLLESPGVETELITAGLDVVELSIEFRIRRATVARIDPDARGGLIGRQLFGDGASLAPGGVMAAALRRL